MRATKLSMIAIATIATLCAGAAAAHADGGPPSVLSIGVGIGYDFPAGLDRPDVTSVRFRLASGLTFEPTLTMAASGDSTDTGMASVDNGAFEIGVGTTVRYPLATHASLELVLLGGLGFDYSASDPDGSNNNSSASVFAITWGLGIDYWLTSRWAMSLSAQNPLLSIDSTSQDQAVGGSTGTSSYAFGAIWEPNVVLMLHLFW